MKCSNCGNDMVRSRAGWLCISCGHIEKDSSTTPTPQIATGKDSHDQMRSNAGPTTVTDIIAPKPPAPGSIAPPQPVTDNDATKPAVDAAPEISNHDADSHEEEPPPSVAPPWAAPVTEAAPAAPELDIAAAVDATKPSQPEPTAADLEAVEEVVAQAVKADQPDSEEEAPAADSSDDAKDDKTDDKKADDKSEPVEPKTDESKAEEEPPSENKTEAKEDEKDHKEAKKAGKKDKVEEEAVSDSSPESKSESKEPEAQTEKESETPKPATDDQKDEAAPPSGDDSKSGEDSKPDSDSKSKPTEDEAPEPEPEPEAKPDIKSKSDSEPKSEPKSEPDAKPESTSDEEPVSDQKDSDEESETEPEPDPKAKSDTKSENDPEPASKTDSEPKSESEPKPEIDSESKSKPDAESDLKPEPEPESDSESDSQPEPEVTSDSESTSDTGTKSDTKPEPDTEPESGAESESKPDDQAEADESLDADTAADAPIDEAPAESTPSADSPPAEVPAPEPAETPDEDPQDPENPEDSSPTDQPPTTADAETGVGSETSPVTPSDTPKTDPDSESKPKPESPAPAPPVASTAPSAAKPPLQPVTHPRPVNGRLVAKIIATLIILVLAAGAGYLFWFVPSHALSAYLTQLTGAKTATFTATATGSSNGFQFALKLDGQADLSNPTQLKFDTNVNGDVSGGKTVATSASALSAHVLATDQTVFFKNTGASFPAQLSPVTLTNDWYKYDLAGSTAGKCLNSQAATLLSHQVLAGIHPTSTAFAGLATINGAQALHLRGAVNSAQMQAALTRANQNLAAGCRFASHNNLSATYELWHSWSSARLKLVVTNSATKTSSELVLDTASYAKPVKITAPAAAKTADRLIRDLQTGVFTVPAAAPGPNLKTAAGRDTQRQADFATFTRGLEAYFLSNNQYPKTLASLTTGPNPALSVIPADPTNKSPNVYTYAPSANAATYTLTACLEDAKATGAGVIAPIPPCKTKSYQVTNLK